MANQKLIDYIKQIIQTKNQEQVLEELKQVGWQEKEIKEAFEELGLIKKQKMTDASSLLGKAWQFYTSRLGVFLIIRLLGSAPYFVFIILPLIFLLRDFSFFNITFLIIFGLLLFFISIFMMFWADISLLQAIKAEDKIGIKESLRQGWHNFFPYIWIWILNFFVTVFSFFLPLGVLSFFLFLLSSHLSVFFLIILAIIFLIISFIPGAIIWIWLSLTNFAFVVEGKRGMAALYRSKQLVEGRWWSVFLRLLLFEVVISAVFIPIIFIIGNFASIISFLFVTPFLFSFVFFIYKDLYLLKDKDSFQAVSKNTRIIFITLFVLGIALIVATLGIILTFLIPETVGLI